MAPELERAARGTETERARVLGSCYWAAGALMAGRGAAPRRGLGVAGRGEPRFARAHWGSAPRAITVPRISKRKNACGVGARRLTDRA